MDEKIIKTQIFDNKTVLDKTAEQPLDIDFTLAEYYPDIAKILKCSCVPYICSKGTNGNMITAEGTAVITVLYLDNDNMLNSCEYRYPFSKNFETGTESEGLCVCVTAATDYLNCRAVTARKIDVHGAVTVHAAAQKRVAADIITDTGLDGVEVLCRKVNANTPLFCSEKAVSIEDEIEIGTAKKDINCIIRYSGSVYVEESKLIAGKVMVKGGLAVDLLYCNDDGRIDSVKENIPFGQMIETETAGENCGTDTAAAICSLEIKPMSDASGRLRTFSVNARILLTANTYCTEQTAVLLDAYSRKYEISLTRTDMTFTEIADRINESFTAKQTAELADGISEMIDLWCCVTRSSCVLQDGILKAEGTIQANVLYYNAEGIPVYTEKEIPFSFSKQTAFTDGDYYSDPVITVASAAYVITGSAEAEIKAVLNIAGAVYRCERLGVLTGLEVNTEKPADRKNMCAMVVYYASAGEKLWDIASSYLADLEEIRQINGVDEDTVAEDKMLLIPLA